MTENILNKLFAAVVLFGILAVFNHFASLSPGWALRTGAMCYLILMGMAAYWLWDSNTHSRKTHK